jgi:zinc resistance-associated protein
MRKLALTGLVLLAGLVLVTAVYAHSPGGHGKGGYGKCVARYGDADLDAVKKFQRETLPLRDELVIKKIELCREFSQAKPDREKIATLQKEIIDIRTKIWQKADETGVNANIRRDGRKGCGRTWGKGIMRKCSVRL